jgi:uncharacterized membrane protein YcaP (DUF421 family)
MMASKNAGSGAALETTMWPDLETMFRLDENALELFLRTSVIYLGLIFALRIIGRRETGALELPELLMIVLIADGVQSGMAGAYTSVTGAVIVAATLIGWNYTITVLTYNFPFARNLLRPKPLILVQDGAYQRHHMRREMVTRDELDSMLRVQGVDDIRLVKQACLEPDGELSVSRLDNHESRGGGARNNKVQG